LGRHVQQPGIAGHDPQPDDRAISVAYARNVVTTRTFDYLGRVRTHTGPRGLAVTTYTVQAVGSGEQRTFSLR
jgi:hypothetical protein